MDMKYPPERKAQKKQEQADDPVRYRVDHQRTEKKAQACRNNSQQSINRRDTEDKNETHKKTFAVRVYGVSADDPQGDRDEGIDTGRDTGYQTGAE